MHTLRYGPTLIVNNKKPDNQQEVNTMHEEYEAPKPILSMRTWAEEFVDAHYKKPHPQKLTIQNQEEESIPPAPPCLLGIEEKK